MKAAKDSIYQYVIKGGNVLKGEVEIGGAKNAALAIIAASIMTDETVTIENIPDVRDVNVLLEAMSQALPVISTDTASGGPAEITSDGRYGKLIPVGGEDALVDALLEMLSDPEECRRAGEQAREAVGRFMPDRAEEAWREYLLQFVRAK